jgi:hypothetical protein
MQGERRKEEGGRNGHSAFVTFSRHSFSSPLFVTFSRHFFSSLLIVTPLFRKAEVGRKKARIKMRSARDFVDAMIAIGGKVTLTP